MPGFARIGFADRRATAASRAAVARISLCRTRSTDCKYRSNVGGVTRVPCSRSRIDRCRARMDRRGVRLLLRTPPFSALGHPSRLSGRSFRIVRRTGARRFPQLLREAHYLLPMRCKPAIGRVASPYRHFRGEQGIFESNRSGRSQGNRREIASSRNH